MSDEKIKYNDISDSETKKEDWMNNKWRPAMGWLYMSICAFDFMFAPILWSLIQAYYKGGVNVQWQPLTLQGAGLFHMAMGAVLGLAAWGRTQEKLNGANNGGITTPTPIQATLPTSTTAPVTATPTFVPQPIAVTVSSTGKKAPMPAEQPEL